MTDPKLVEKAGKVFYDLGGVDINKYGFVKKSIAIIALALQAHGEEVRRKTVEECIQSIRGGYGSSKHEYLAEEMILEIRKLLEVKGA